MVSTRHGKYTTPEKTPPLSPHDKDDDNNNDDGGGASLWGRH